ncbi:glycosyltransferase [Empedobacter brevis]|uniref:glycosyltransferase n=1 Tax=Empedobacter brevis TaxID=247 RepID=UPI002FE37847
MDIIIKSFNRAYYLDRCIQSIHKNVKGNFQIKIIDDGTPKEYLDKIVEKYSVEIIPTANYAQKSKNIKEGKTNDGFVIPTESWRQAVENASEYFLITEDDVWFTKEINCNDLIDEMKLNNIHLAKLGILGIYSDDNYVEIKSISNELETTYPLNTFTSNRFIMNLFIFNKFKFFTILYKLGLVDNHTKRKYWILNSILMGLYRKDYWLYIWKDSINLLDEKIQLRNAGVWFGKYKSNRNIISRTTTEKMKTTFKSSASGQYHNYDIHLSVDRVNQILNEVWLKGEFNAMENYPKDFSDNYIKTFLDKENHPDAQSVEWQKWAEKFKQQYRNLGAEVDN